MIGRVYQLESWPVGSTTDPLQYPLVDSKIRERLLRLLLAVLPLFARRRPLDEFSKVRLMQWRAVEALVCLRERFLVACFHVLAILVLLPLGRERDVPRRVLLVRLRHRLIILHCILIQIYGDLRRGFFLGAESALRPILLLDRLDHLLMLYRLQLLTLALEVLVENAERLTAQSFLDLLSLHCGLFRSDLLQVLRIADTRKEIIAWLLVAHRRELASRSALSSSPLACLAPLTISGGFEDMLARRTDVDRGRVLCRFHFWLHLRELGRLFASLAWYSNVPECAIFATIKFDFG